MLRPWETLCLDLSLENRPRPVNARYPSVVSGGGAKATVGLCSWMTELEALERRLTVDNNWLVPWQMTLAPQQIDCREAIIRLILPARILRKVRYGMRLDGVTNATEFIHCVCPLGGCMQGRAKETQPKCWIDLIILALERTGRITKKDDTYAITPK